MADPCWVPVEPDAPNWEGDGVTDFNRWTPGAYSDSIVCRAIACLLVPCSPFERDSLWQNDGVSDANICGE